jgi:hypothetical protein
MHPFLRAALGAVLAAAITLSGTDPADAQFSYNPGQNVNPAAQQAQMVNQAAPASVGFRYSAPVGVPWGGVYVQSPVAGYLQGTADVINSTGQYNIQVQQAKLGQEQARQAKLDTRRKMMEQKMWEDANRPTYLTMLDQERNSRLAEARMTTSLTRIISGDPLNALLNHSKAIQASGIVGPRMPIDQEILPLINVTNGATSGNTGLLKDGGRLQWPLVLDDRPFDKERKQIETMMQEAVGQATRYGRVQADLQRSLLRTLDKFDNAVVSRAREMTPTEFIQARRYLREVRDGVKVFQDPKVGNYFNDRWRARGETVTDLIGNMSRDGLVFAPASPGGEAAYRSLHTSMVAYDQALSGMASSK